MRRSSRQPAPIVEGAGRGVRQNVKFTTGMYTVFGGVSEARKLAQQEFLMYSLVAGGVGKGTSFS